MGSSGGIAKRYFVMNAFDGSLTALGIIIGSLLAGIVEPRVILLSGMGASIAMGVSGTFGAYMTESAVKKEEYSELKAAMLVDIGGDNVVNQAMSISAIFVSLVDGISPFLAAVITFMPFLLASFIAIEITTIYLLSVIMNAISLFCLGIYLGNVSQEHKKGMILSGVKMIIAGIVVAVLVLMLETISH